MAATRRSVCIHQMNRVNSRTDYDDSTINIVIVIIIIIIINLSVKFSGTQALIAGKQPLAVYEHCLMHCGNLVAQSILKSSAPIRDAISTANDADVFSRQSTKLSNVLKEVKKQHVCSALLRPLCPT